MTTKGENPEQSSLFNFHLYWHKGFLDFVILLAVLIRLDEIKAPGHLIDREFTSAIFARAFYFENNDSIEPWRREIALATREQQPILEPPLTDLLVSWIYRLLGKEELWYARILTNSLWLIGGIFMYKVTRQFSSMDAALLATGYYLFVPMGIEIRRSFQPDALMMLLFLVSLYSMLRYFQGQTCKWLILAGIITGFTILLRPLVLFGLLAAFIAMAVYTKGHFLRAIDKRFVLFCMLALAASTAYYGYGIFVADYMNWKVGHSFRPFLFTRLGFWQGWFDNAASVAGHAALLLAIGGFFLLQKGLARVFIVGLTVGYIIFGMVFTYHTHTHPYYHIQLIPIVGICASPILVGILNIVRKKQDKSWSALVAVILLITIYFSYQEVRNSLYIMKYEDPATDREIGEIVKHSSRTVFVAYNYGLPLEYYGELTGDPWPVRIDDPFYRSPNEKERTVQERIDALGYNPEYFVITQFDLLNRKHMDLKAYLNENCLLAARTDSYLVYSSCKMVTQK